LIVCLALGTRIVRKNAKDEFAALFGKQETTTVTKVIAAHSHGRDA
jgi:hypothetical protein